MRKESTKYIKSIFLAVLTAMLLVSCGGGGGGGGGVVAFQNNAQMHNGGDAGGWNGSGDSKNNGSNSNSEVELIITGSTPLSVERYEYNGVTYNSAEDLINVLSTSTLPDSFEVDFYVEGATEPRKARVSANGTAGNGQDIFIEHQYMATVTLPDADGFPGAPITIPFYKRDGISLADIANAVGNETVGSGADEVIFELRKLKIGTIEYDKNGSLAVNESGDVTFDGNSIKGVYDKWGISSNKTIQFSSSVNDGDSIAISTPEPIMRIDNPGDKTISLDLRNMNTNNPTFIRSFVNTPENVSELVLPTCINEISADALSNATNLTRVVIPDNVETIGENAFKGLENLQSVTLPTNANFTEIPESLFEGCTRLSSINIPDSVTTIGDCAFDGCVQLSSVTLSNNLEYIKNATFRNCGSLTSITFPDTLIDIMDEAFANCSKLDSISIPANVTSIGNSAFRECFTDSSRASGVSVTFLGNPYVSSGAFCDSTHLQTILSVAATFDLGNGSDASIFSNCTELTTIRLSTPTTIVINSDLFSSLNTGERITIEFGSLRTGSGANIHDKSITLTTGTNSFEKTPHMRSNTPAYDTQFSITDSSWGSKSIIIQHSSGYYQWNGSTFISDATAPAEWND